MKAITFFGEVMLLIICMPLLLVCAVVNYIWEKVDDYKTAIFFKRFKEQQLQNDKE